MLLLLTGDKRKQLHLLFSDWTSITVIPLTLNQPSICFLCKEIMQESESIYHAHTHTHLPIPSNTWQTLFL